jgi:hypothetical protein
MGAPGQKGSCDLGDLARPGARVKSRAKYLMKNRSLDVLLENPDALVAYRSYRKLTNIAQRLCVVENRKPSGMDSAIWYDFIKGLRAEQDRLRAELEPYEIGGMRVGTRPSGGVWGDTTDATIAQIKGEITSLQRTIDKVIAEQGLRDA